MHKKVILRNYLTYVIREGNDTHQHQAGNNSCFWQIVTPGKGKKDVHFFLQTLLKKINSLCSFFQKETFS